MTYTLDMTINYKPSISPVPSLLSHLEIGIGSDATDLARAIRRIPTHRPLPGPQPIYLFLARLAVSEILIDPNSKLAEGDIHRIEHRLLRILAGQPSSRSECQHRALKHYHKLSAGETLNRHHVEHCIRHRLPRLMPYKQNCASLSTQALFQLITPSPSPIETISLEDWTRCALLLFQQCSTMP